MRYFKSIILAGIILSFLAFSNIAAFAESIGAVDLDAVVAQYKKAQIANNYLDIQEADIQKFVAESKRALYMAKSPDEQETLQDKLNKELTDRKASFNKEKAAYIQSIQKDVAEAINTVMKKNKLEAIIKRDTLITGGTDITNEVINLLNSSITTKDTDSKLNSSTNTKEINPKQNSPITTKENGSKLNSPTVTKEKNSKSKTP